MGPFRQPEPGRVSKLVEPFVDGGDLQDGLMANGELVIAGGHGPMTPQMGDSPLHSVTAPVVDRIEGGRLPRRRCRTWSAGTGIVAAIPRRRR